MSLIKVVWYLLKVKNVHFGLYIYPWGPNDTKGSPRGATSKFMVSKIFADKRYDSLMKIIPLIVGLTYCVNSGELLEKVPVLSAPLPLKSLARQS